MAMPSIMPNLYLIGNVFVCLVPCLLCCASLAVVSCIVHNGRSTVVLTVLKFMHRPHISLIFGLFMVVA